MLAVSLLRALRYGPLLAWAAFFTITATAMVSFTVSGDTDGGPWGRPARTELLRDVSATRGLLGALVNPGEPSDARHVAEVADGYAQKWASYGTNRGDAAAATFAQLAEHATLLAEADTDTSRRVALSHVLADGDDLIVAANDGDVANTRSGTYHHHPALDGGVSRDAHLEGPDARTRVGRDAPDTRTPPTLGDTPR